MLIKRSLALGAALAAFAGVAVAQFDGPAPVAWRWTQPTQAPPLGSPVIDGETVFVAVGQRAYALDKDSGNQKWRFPVGEPIEGYFRAGVLKAGNTLVAASDNKAVFGLDATTGASKWQALLPVAIIGEPVLVQNTVVMALADNSLYALNVSDGNPVWSAAYKVFDGLYRNLGVHGGNLLVFTSIGELKAIDVTTQKTVWTARFSQIGPDAKPVVFGDNVYVVTGPYVAVLNAVTGRGRGQVDTREQLAFAPAVTAGGVFVVTREGKALAFDSDLRRPLFPPIDLGSLAAVNPSAIGDMFLAPTTNGALNLIDPKTGSVVWSYLVRPTVSSTGAPTAGASTGGDLAGGNPKGGATGGGQTKPVPVLAVAASGPAVLSGSSLFVLVEDGSLLAFDRKNGVDLTPPDVKLLWPSMGDMVNGQTLELIFKIEDEASGINTNSLKIDVDGTALDHEFGRDGIAFCRISSLSKNKPLNNGRKKITVTVTDWMGNLTVKSYSLMVDNSLRPLQRPTEGTNNPGGRGGGLSGAGSGGGGRSGGG